MKRRFPHGVVDDIEGIAALTSAAGVGLHVDNCLGGFLLSHLQIIGEFTRHFDFLVHRHVVDFPCCVLDPHAWPPNAAVKLFPRVGGCTR